MNASTIPDVFQHNVFAIGYLCVAGNTISTLRTAAKPFYKFFVALGEHTWYFLTGDLLYVIVGSIILAAGLITGLQQTFQIRYGEYEPSPSDKVKNNALNFVISFFCSGLDIHDVISFVLRIGIFSSFCMGIISTHFPDEGAGMVIGGGILIGIVFVTFYIIWAMFTVFTETSTPVRKSITPLKVLIYRVFKSPKGRDELLNRCISNEILFWTMLGGFCGLLLGFLAIVLTIVFALATKDAAIVIKILKALLLIPFFAIIGGITGGMSYGLVVISRFMTLILHLIVFLAGSRLMFLLLGFKTVICQHCLRCTVPFRSHYKKGTRYCEHCGKRVEAGTDPDKVIIAFGDIRPKKEGCVIGLANPDFEQKKQPIEVSEVYVDTATCNPQFLERFITYIVNYPPTHGLRSVKIFYWGELDDLGENLKNALRNTFAELHEWGISRNKERSYGSRREREDRCKM